MNLDPAYMAELEQHPLVLLNRQQSLYFTDGQNVYFLPQDWAEEFQDGVEHDVLEVYCYAPMFTRPDSGVETMWIPLAELTVMRQIDEPEARRIHPKLFRWLDLMNSGRDNGETWYDEEN